MAKKLGLGKGLSALIPSVPKEQEEIRDLLQEIDVKLIDPNPDQPRQKFHENQLFELSESIRHNGVIQPIIVTQQGSRYIVIAGERRWRATKLAGYTKIPAVVRQVEKGQMLSLALLENIQRQELNPIEEALAYRKLIDTHDFTHESLATNLGKSRVTISNTLRLLRLPDDIKNMIQDLVLSFGHARCLITLEDKEKMIRLARQCIDQKWSVRELEKRVALEKEERKKPPKAKKDPILKESESVLRKYLNQKVSISGDVKKGKITIAYGSEDEFKKLLTFLSSEGGQDDAEG
ncbi:ParB/RepB/Spo0J family partition protein [Acanthopleuribacter pedis]|uniref:ParB/RepB/Spo0J family partition protein n=1 Tax=Acanthopleuribacter pedis TaxID=442870 RepID=A0A8J7U322_9BACT|nr:ParB/RepB/Spo0J family partition protein [Acanthopleuribacter pedis]MBO1317878.1 ParB/RepB/Spo0J family partition protein [Acanthopleuribacter pedis]